MKISKKMPVTRILLGFSYLIAAGGIGSGSLWMIFKFNDTGYFINGFLILAGSLFLAALTRMFADIGQIIFDIRIDMQNSFKQTNALNQDLKNQLQLQAASLNKNLLDILSSLSQASQEAKELSQRFAAIKDNFDQMNCDSKDMNQNIYQIRTFFEQIEKHLDLKQ